MGQRVFGSKVIGRVRITHHGSKTIGCHIDTLDLIGPRTQRHEDVFECLQGCVDWIAAGAQTEVVAADFPARAESIQQTIRPKAISHQTAQGFLNGIVLRRKASQGQLRGKSRCKAREKDVWADIRSMARPILKMST